MNYKTAELQDQNWNDLKYLLALYRAGSYSAAAGLLAVSETTVARRVDAAAEQLGAPLIERSGGRIGLSEFGRLAVAHAERMEAEQAALCTAISGASQVPQGSVRLTSTAMIINHVLIPRVGMMQARHPALELELIADARDFSLSRREADLAVRLSRPTREMQILTRRIGSLEYAVYAAADIEPAADHWIVLEESMSALPHAAWLRSRLAKTGRRPALVTNDAESMLSATRHGVGKSILPAVVGDAIDGLRRCEEPVDVSREVWLLVHPDIRDLARIEASIQWLEQVFDAPSSHR